MPAPVRTPARCDNKPPDGVVRSIGGGEVGGCNEDPLDRAIGRVATPQGGVVSSEQLRALGATRREVGHRLRCGRLVPLHRGVYAVGHVALAPRARDVAALLAAGPGAFLSHGSAAARWELLSRREGPVELTIVGRRARCRPGLIVHHADHVRSEELARRDGLPVSAPFRTLLELAATVPATELDRPVAEAQVLHLLTAEDLQTGLEAAAGRPGAARLRSVVGGDDAAPTRNRLERTFLRLVANADLPRPRINVRVGRFERDFVWARLRVVVEVDGWAAHGHRAAFESDRSRDAELVALGYVVMRFTWRQVTAEPVLVAARLAQVLAAPPARAA